eukprot:g28879.t1
MAIFGGTPKGPQGKELKKKMPQVLVATPGRLQDFMSSGEVNLSQAQLLVLDEADRMLDMGFEPEIAKILSQAREWKEDYMHVNVGETEEKTNTNWPKPGPSTLAVGPATRPTEEFFRLGDDEKDDKLWQILSGLSDDAKAICFANTKRRIDSFQKTFWSKGFDSVCSRGLDIKDVTHVVNLDMARDVESYVRRPGAFRCGFAFRAGRISTRPVQLNGVSG